MDAALYNKRAEGRHWEHRMLPAPLNDYPGDSHKFFLAVKELQTKYGIDPADGKLGGGTVEILERILNIRMHVDPVGWMPDEVYGIKVEKLPTRRKEPSRSGGITFVIIHTTGSGIYNYAKKHNLSPFEGAKKYYTSPSAYASHTLAGREEGEFCQNIPFNEIGYHAGVGEKGRELYRNGLWTQYVWPVSGGGPKKLSSEDAKKHYDWWSEKWGETAKDPYALTYGDPNGRSVGFDFLAHPYGGDYTDWQYKCLAALCLYLADTQGFPLNGRFILTHSDTHPLTRCNKNGGWDPGPKFSYDKLWAAISALRG